MHNPLSPCEQIIMAHEKRSEELKGLLREADGGIVVTMREWVHDRGVSAAEMHRLGQLRKRIGIALGDLEL